MTASSRPCRLGRTSSRFFSNRRSETKAGEGQLDQAGQDQAAGDQVGDRGLELGDQEAGTTTAGAEQADEQDADDGEHPRAGADDAGVGVGLTRPIRVFLRSRRRSSKPMPAIRRPPGRAREGAVVDLR